MRKISSRFSIATHILAMMAFNHPLTGDQMAGSVQTNPVVIRRIIGQLKKAGLVNVKAGTGGARLTRDADQITLLDIFNAVEVVEDNVLFNFHEHPNLDCPIGANIERSLRRTMSEAQAAMEDKLARVTLRQLAGELMELE